MAGKVLRFSAAEAADVLRGSKSALLKDAADLRDLEISDGAVLCGETDEGTAFCELRVTSFFQGSFSSLPQDIVLDDGMKAKKFEAGVEVAHIKFEVVKVAFSPSLSSALRYSAVTPAAGLVCCVHGLETLLGTYVPLSPSAHGVRCPALTRFVGCCQPWRRLTSLPKRRCTPPSWRPSRARGRRSTAALSSTSAAATAESQVPSSSLFREHSLEPEAVRGAVELIRAAAAAGGRLDVVGVDVSASGVAAANALARDLGLAPPAPSPQGAAKEHGGSSALLGCERRGVALVGGGERGRCSGCASEGRG